MVSPKAKAVFAAMSRTCRWCADSNHGKCNGWMSSGVMCLCKSCWPDSELEDGVWRQLMKDKRAAKKYVGKP